LGLSRARSLHPVAAEWPEFGPPFTTTTIVRKFTVIGIEDLNVRGMMANRRVARAIADIGAFEFRRQLDYKAPMNGSRIVVADRWFPSSKTCSTVGTFTLVWRYQTASGPARRVV
jgi:putative transposase